MAAVAVAVAEAAAAEAHMAEPSSQQLAAEKPQAAVPKPEGMVAAETEVEKESKVSVLGLG